MEDLETKAPEFRDHLVKIISNSAPIKFRARIVKTILEDSDLNSYLAEDQVVLPEKYNSILNNINGFIIICNYTTGLYEYVSGGLKSYLGYDTDGYSKQEITNFIFTIIYDGHGKFILNHLLPTVFEYFKKNSNPVNGTDYRYTVCIKVRNIYNIYAWYLIDTVIIEVDDSGFPFKTLVTCTNINQFKKDNCVYYNIMKKNEDGIYEIMLEGSENDDKNNDVYKLTHRELQIINLIAQGFTNKQIADKLSISLNTVQTHRKNLTKKTKCSGTAELVNFAFSRGIL